MALLDPLRAFLKGQTRRDLELSFKDIERIIGVTLPRDAALAQWWENPANVSRDNNAQARSWMSAGYKAYLIAGCSRVRFQKAA